MSFSASAAPEITLSEFLYETAPFPECHASTIVESRGQLLAAFFGGTKEKATDVCIWLSRRENSQWSAPEKVADGVQPDGKQLPCWNPVLFQPKGSTSLQLYYKVGPSPSTWWGVVKTSEDGKIWSAARKLPDGILGPIKNKPLQLRDGTILCGSSTEDHGWRVHFEWSKDNGLTWEKSAPINDGKEIEAIQPTLLGRGDGVLALCRNGNPGSIWATSATAPPAQWSALRPTTLPNPNSGIDGVTARDGRHYLIYNHTPKGRSPLNLAISSDGETWQPSLVLEKDPGEYSYPAIIQTTDGNLHVTYTWKRKKVKHVVIRL